jgi:hypothetical protein
MRFARSAAARLRDSTLLVIACVVVLSVGTAAAAKLITGADIKNHSITGKDIKKHSVPLSALKGTVAGPAGAPGPVGPEGKKGQPGVIGATGPVGPSAFSAAFSFDRPIAATVEPNAKPKFLGKPVLLELFVRDQGSMQSTVTIGTTEAQINDKAKFKVTVCYQLAEPGSEVEVLSEAEESGSPGVSPVVGARTSVAAGSSFVVNSGPSETAEEEEEPLFVSVGPCVINTTASKLNDNDRVEGIFWIASG